MTLGFLNKKSLLFNLAANLLSALMVGIVAFSVYMPINARAPAEFSKNISAPIVITFSVLIVVLLTSRKFEQYIDIKSVYNGFILLGLSGSLLRLISY